MITVEHDLTVAAALFVIGIFGCSFLHDGLQFGAKWGFFHAFL